MNRAPPRIEADGPLDLLVVVAAGVADDDVIGVVLGQGVADGVQGVGEAGAADDVGGAAGLLLVEEVGRGQRRGVEGGLVDGDARSSPAGAAGRAGSTGCCWSGTGTGGRRPGAG